MLLSYVFCILAESKSNQVPDEINRNALVRSTDQKIKKKTKKRKIASVFDDQAAPDDSAMNGQPPAKKRKTKGKSTSKPTKKRKNTKKRKLKTLISNAKPSQAQIKNMNAKSVKAPPPKKRKVTGEGKGVPVETIELKDIMEDLNIDTPKKPTRLTDSQFYQTNNTN